MKIFQKAMYIQLHGCTQEAYAGLLYDLMVAKPEPSGFNKESLHLISDEICFLKQKTNIRSAQSDWVDLICGIPQGSAVGYIL